jgi:hypothetical protein
VLKESNNGIGPKFFLSYKDGREKMQKIQEARKNVR